MTSVMIQVSDQAVRAALTRLQNAVEHPQPLMHAIGERIMARVEDRFKTSSGPDGQPWAPNSPVTLARYIESRGGVGQRGLNKKGKMLAAGKKPLIATGALSENFHVSATDDSVTVATSVADYGPMQQFGGKKSEFPNLWGDIPARPFFPITPGGDLYPEESDLIVAQLSEYIRGAAGG